HPCEHISYKTLVAGHIHESHLRSVGKSEACETQIDGDTAFLLFFEAIGIGPGEAPDQEGLSVIDVAGGTDHETARGRHGPITPGAASPWSAPLHSTCGRGGPTPDFPRGCRASGIRSCGGRTLPSHPPAPARPSWRPRSSGGPRFLPRGSPRGRHPAEHPA